MGVSTDGILFFGIEIGDHKPWGDDDDDWEDVVAKAAGIEKPADAYPDEGDHSLEAEAIRVKCNAWFVAKWKAVEAFWSVDVGFHCSSDDPMWYVAVKRLRWIARRGYPEKIPSDLGNPTSTEMNDMRRLVGILGCKWEEPTWWLVSLWG